MQILLTGATGYVGRRLLPLLLEAGHQVTAVLRAPGHALPQGVTPLIADLAEPERIAAAARGQDAVLHLAFASHGDGFEAAVATEARLVQILAEVLAGTGTRLILSNGTAFYGDAGGRLLTEDAPVPDGPLAMRWHATRPAHLRMPEQVLELRLASFVHGHGGSVFLPHLVAHARATGRVPYVAPGDNRLSAVHVEDAAAAYLAALHSPGAQGVYHIAADDSPSMWDLAEALALATGAEPQAMTLAEAMAALGFTGFFVGLDNGLSSRRARQELGWQPRARHGLLWDVAHGSYAFR